MECSQNTVKDAIFIQEASIDVYKIKKVRTKVFHKTDTPLACIFLITGIFLFM